jgi:hypothetical protein
MEEPIMSDPRFPPETPFTEEEFQGAIIKEVEDDPEFGEVLNQFCTDIIGDPEFLNRIFGLKQRAIQRAYDRIEEDHLHARKERDEV